MKNIRPLVPVNPEGLDDVARSLLVDNITSVPDNVAPSINVTNPENYIILPSKTHGTYSYQDLLVGRSRLSLHNNVSQEASKLGFSVANTAQENNGLPYIGNINWAQALSLNSSIGGLTLNLRQYADFLELLKSGNAFDGNGKKIQKDKLDETLDEILTVREPYRGEWLDADFKVVNEVLKINYDHRLVNGRLVYQKSEPLESCVDSEGYIDFSSMNRQGLPTKKSRKKEIYFWPPMRDNNSVARFGAVSDRAGLGCFWVPACSDSWLGVREAREKK